MSRLLVAVPFVLAAACGGKSANTPIGFDDARTPLAKKTPGVEPTVSSYVVASIGERSIGPFFSRRIAPTGASGLVAWVTVAEGTGRRVIVLPTDGNGAPRGGESVVASVSVDTTTMIVRPLRGPAPGFVVAWVSLTDRGKSLWAVAVGDNGLPRAKPVEITRTMDDLTWVDVLPTERGAVCLWAEETRGGDANLVVASLDTEGKVRESPARAARGVVGWHALELPTGFGLSTVASVPLDPKTRPDALGYVHEPRKGGALSFQRFDPEGHTAGAPIALTTKPIVSGDVEVVRDGGKLVFAWTDRSTEEPAVAVATLDEKNVIEGPKRIVEARGGAALLGLAGGPTGVGLMFESPVRRKEDTRHVHLARIGERLFLERPPLRIDTVGRNAPELAATSTGYAVLATTADCAEGSAACPNATATATVYRTDARARLVQREPLTFQTDPAALGWGMACEIETCVTLAASGGGPGSPARIRTAAIRPHPNVKVAPLPVVEAPTADGARIQDVTAVATGESVMHIASTRFGNGALIATLGSRERRAGDESRNGTVTLSTRVVDDDGNATPGVVITTTALPHGGVAVAAGDNAEDGAVVAWVGRESGDPEVHLTRIDKRGRRQQDVLITSSKGDASDVTVTRTPTGWLVAWVDGRDGNGEVYAAKVSPELTRSREERITRAPGDASDLVAFPQGDIVWLAWADSRESPKDGIADIFVSAVKMQDAKRSIDEQRVLATAAHSRTPHFAAGPTGLRIAWIEEAPMGSESPNAGGYGAFWTTLDEAGRPQGRPARIPLAGEGAATAVAIEGGARMHAVVARSMTDAISLDAVDLTPGAARISSLLSLDGPPSLDVSLVFERGALYFNDDGPQLADRRARRARIAWAR